MTAVVIDDHLLRDLLADRAGPALIERIGGTVATTNLYYLRLCRSARVLRKGGNLLGSWTERERIALARVLVELRGEIVTLPLRDLTWQIADLIARYRLSTLGAEAVAAALTLGATLCVWSGDDGPRIREATRAEGLAYEAIER